jgi:uncharacterized membrane protein YphA (DoxX/SURF4 family)
MKDWVDLIGRIFVATLFFYEAVDTLWYFKDAKEILVGYGITAGTGIWVAATVFCLVLGATSLTLGYLSRLGAFLLLLYLLPYTIIVHSFWNDPPDIQRIQAQLFMLKLAICGGLMFLMVNKPQKYSVRRLIHVMRLPK